MIRYVPWTVSGVISNLFFSQANVLSALEAVRLGDERYKFTTDIDIDTNVDNVFSDIQKQTRTAKIFAIIV